MYELSLDEKYNDILQVISILYRALIKKQIHKAVTVFTITIHRKRRSVVTTETTNYKFELPTIYKEQLSAAKKYREFAV